MQEILSKSCRSLSLALGLFLACGCADDDNKKDNGGDTPTVTKHCAGVNLVFFPGGSEDCPFASIVYNGAQAAVEDLGPNIEYYWSSWNEETMVEQLTQAIDTQPDGIAIMGHPGSTAYESEVARARSLGIIVTSQNTPLDALEATYKSEGFGYVGALQYEAGYLLAESAVSRFSLTSGRAMVWGIPGDTPRAQRTIGLVDAFTAAGLVVDRVDIDDATNADASAGTPFFVDYINNHTGDLAPDIVVTDHGALTAYLPTYLQAAGLGTDDVYGVGFDLSTDVAEGIRDGWIDLTLDQQPYLQGYLPIVQMCLTYKYRFSGLRIDTGSGLVHKDNVDLLIGLVEQQIR